MPVEFHPEHPSAPPSGLELQEAFRTYLYGLTKPDITDVVYASHIIERTTTPYADDINVATAALQNVLLGGDQHHKMLHDALGDILRAYVYSGLAVDTDAMVRTAEHFGFDKFWVRHQIEPVGTRIKNDMEGISRSERRQVRAIGNLALKRLGVLPKRSLSRSIFLLSQRMA